MSCEAQQFDSESYWQEQFRRQDLWEMQPEIILRRLAALERRVQALESPPGWEEGA